MKSVVTTVTAYLATLPPERRKEFRAVLQMVRAHMPKGYKQELRWGMISWEIPLAKYPDTYNGHPLCYAALAAQKNHLALYLMGAYMQTGQAAAIKAAFQKEGKRLDMGKSCIRFRKAADLPLAALGKSIAAVTPAKYIANYEKVKPKR